MNLGEVIGFLGGVLTTFAYLPQVIRVLKLKSAHEISTIFTTCLLIGIILWLIYGIYLDLMPIIIWNSVSAVLVAMLVIAKIRYGRNSSV